MPKFSCVNKVVAGMRVSMPSLACVFLLLASSAVAPHADAVDADAIDAGVYSIAARRFVPARSNASGEFTTELDNAAVTEKVQLTGASTALIMVDVWNDSSSPSLSENEGYRMLPLLALARQFGWLVIHAPSENQEWASIDVLPGEILVTGTDGRPGSKSLCFPHLTNNNRTITHIVMAGYDTNFCVLDKPCGTIEISTQAANQQHKMEVLLVRDGTLPESRWYKNQFFSHLASVNMIESARWLASATVTTAPYIRSVTVADLAAGFGVPPQNPIAMNATKTLKFPELTAVSNFTRPFAVPPSAAIVNGTAALVVVSCSSDYHNNGFRARVAENRVRQLEPLLDMVRKSSMRVLHLPNGHKLDGVCQPLQGEAVLDDTASFDALLKQDNISTLIYVGYAANTDMLFGIGGMARYYSMSRYLYQPVPAYYWVDQATLGFETGLTLAVGEWMQKQALAYRQPLVTKLGNILEQSSLEAALTFAAKQGGLPAAEVAALHDLWTNCGGSKWKYTNGTDAVGGGKPWQFQPGCDPCAEGWFGVQCGSSPFAPDQQLHVLRLFPNTRDSGNPLTGQLPDSIGGLAFLEHIYTSNDKTPSSLSGGIPESFGDLVHLKCMYFSHNNLTEQFPPSLSKLKNLQVFLARFNSIPGPLPDFSQMPHLLNVWFDHNDLEGSLDALGALKNLTFLMAGNNARIHGSVPASLCAIKCDASDDGAIQCPLPVPGCCKITSCGDKPSAPPHPPPTSMGECIPQ